MLDKKFLDKVCEQIISETRIDDDKLYLPFPFLPFLPFSSLSPPNISFYPSYLYSFFSYHCKDVYGLNEQEEDYVWNRYKVEITTLMDKKEMV